MAKRLLTTVLTTFTLLIGQQIFSGCETESADNPEYSAIFNDSSTEDSSGSQNNSGNNSNGSATKTLSWKDPVPTVLDKGESLTLTVINNEGSVAWAVTPSAAASISSASSDGTSAVIMAANSSDAVSLKVTATDQSTKKSISANISLTNTL